MMRLRWPDCSRSPLPLDYPLLPDQDPVARFKQQSHDGREKDRHDDHDDKKRLPPLMLMVAFMAPREHLLHHHSSFRIRIHRRRIPHKAVNIWNV